MPPVEINMSGIPVNGIGGLGLLTVIVFITLVLPQAWWLTVVGVAGGIVLGTMLVLSRRRHGISPDDNGDRSVFHLGASAQAVGATSSEGARPRTPRVLTSVVAQLR
ncbi:MAG: hypothetical protein ABI051_13975 [Vicinamibacterales bacterium]